jgi:hypothetical protein
LFTVVQKIALTAIVDQALAGLVAFSHLQFSQIRGRQPYLIVRKILYVIDKVSRPRGENCDRLARL